MRTQKIWLGRQNLTSLQHCHCLIQLVPNKPLPLPLPLLLIKLFCEEAELLRGVSREFCELWELGLQARFVLCQLLAVVLWCLELTMQLWWRFMSERSEERENTHLVWVYRCYYSLLGMFYSLIHPPPIPCHSSPIPTTQHSPPVTHTQPVFRVTCSWKRG